MDPKESDSDKEEMKQIEDFYKRKLSSIMEENDDNNKHIDELQIKNSLLANKKNKLTVELDLTREELSNMKDFLHAAVKELTQLLARPEQVKKKTTWIESEDSAVKKKLTQSMTQYRVLTQPISLKELSKITVKYDDLRTQYEEKCQCLELQQQIEELKKKLEICQDEKERLKKLLDENNDKLLEFEDRLESAKDIELVSNQQEELNKQKQMATTSQSKKGYCKNTSEDEATSKQRTTRRPPKKENSRTPKDASVIKHNKSARLAGLPPPPSEPLPERRRNAPRRKLYEADECPQDILPLQNTRILRPRRK